MFASSPVGCGWGEVIKSWHRHGVWTCSPTSLTTLSTMPRNIWTRYNFCLFSPPPLHQMQQLVFLHLLRFKDFFVSAIANGERGVIESIHFLPNTEKWLSISPPRRDVHALFLSLSPALFPNAPPSLSRSSHLWTPLPFLLASKKKRTLNPAPGSVFHERRTPVKFKGEMCSGSYARFRLFPQVCFCWVGFSSYDERAAAACSHARRSTSLSSLPFKG